MKLSPIFSKASLPVWFRNLLDHPPTWPESEIQMILQMQAKVHGLGNVAVLTYTYPILSWFEATFAILIIIIIIHDDQERRGRRSQTKLAS